MKTLFAALLVALAHAPRLEAGILYAWEGSCRSRYYVTLMPTVRTELPCPASVHGTVAMPDAYVPGTRFDYEPRELHWGEPDMGFVLFDEFFEEGSAPMRHAEALRGWLPTVEGAGEYLEYSDAPAKIEITPEAWRFLVAIQLGCPCFEIQGGTSVFRRISEPPALAVLLAGTLGTALACSAPLAAARRARASRRATARSAAP